MILPRLRETTRQQHQRLEQVINLPVRLSSSATYTGLLEDFYGLYQPLETRLAIHLELHDSGLSANRLLKHKLLEQDLIELGHSPEAIESLRKCERLPGVEDVFSAAGCLYVLEGATLGGQIVRRQVDERLKLPRECCQFFDGDGPRVGEMWTSFCAMLTAIAADDVQSGDSIVRGATETFTCFEEWMQ